MPIPDFQAIMRPWLELASDGKEHALQDVISAFADRFSLTEAERSELLPSGFQAKFTNRVAWAATHLNKAGAIARVSRGQIRASPHRGRQLLGFRMNPSTCRSLRGSPSIRNSRTAARHRALLEAPATLENVTPAEAMEAAALSVRQAVGSELARSDQGSRPRTSSSDLSSTCCWRWGMAGVAATLVTPSVVRATVASTASSKKIDSDWMPSTFRRNAGMDLSVDRSCRCSQVASMARRLPRAS